MFYEIHKFLLFLTSRMKFLKNVFFEAIDLAPDSLVNR